MRQKIMPTTWFMVLLFLSIALHFVFPILRLFNAWYRYLGILLILFGVAMNLWADSLFKKSGTTVKPHLLPSSLELSGPFRLSRHPMYLGMAAILLGLAVILGSLVSFIFPVIFVLIMEILFIPHEERNLAAVFGEEYLGYKRRTRRWI
jgi:protein-S-isoprenylcysteine O-methyltransferase Ste14